MPRVPLVLVCGVLVCAAVPLASAATSPPVSLHNQTWHCTTAQDGTVVTVLIDNGNHIDGAHLDAGCTGSIVLHIVTNGGDGVKVHSGAHDLAITGDITCTGKPAVVHQDGVQAMGGQHVLLGSTSVPGALVVNCPTGNNGGLFVNAGKGNAGVADYPTDVVADHAIIYEKNAPVNIGADSVSSGVRNSVLHHGSTPASPTDCIRIDPAAITPVNESNTCVK